MFTVSIETGNSAFWTMESYEYDPAMELADLLRRLADRLEEEGVRSDLADARHPVLSAHIRDRNGNTVGEWTHMRVVS